MPDANEANPSTPATPGMSPRTVVWLSVAVCLLTALLAFWAMRAVEAPWTGRTGSLIFRGKAGDLRAADRYLGVVRFYFDSANPRRAKLDVDDWINVGLWCGSLAVFCVSIGAAATAPWWGRWIRRPDGALRPVKPAPPPRWSVAVLVFAMALGAFLRVQTLGNAPFWDEQDNMSRNFHGIVEYTTPASPPVWKPAGFKGAVWENMRGNNPYLYSLLSQGSVNIWRAFSGAETGRFSIAAIRMPAVVTGVLAIAALWWTLNVMGLGRAAPWAALLLSIHCLAIEFSVEARGHGVNLLCSALLLGVAWRAVKGGGPRVWLAYGILLFCSLLSHPASLYHVACLNLFVASLLLWEGWKNGDAMARCGLARWVVTNTAAAMAYFWILAPAMPQAALFIAHKFPTGSMGLAWNTGFFITYASGLCAMFAKTAPESVMHGQAFLSWFFGGFRQIAPLGIWSLVVFPILFAAGWPGIWKGDGGRPRALLLAASVVSGPLMVFVQPLLTKNSLLFFWYIIFITPAVVAIAACGLVAAGDWLAARLHRQGKRDLAGGLVAVVALGWLFWISSSVVAPGEWRVGHADFKRKPFPNPWHAEPGQIARDAFTRGRHHRWISYEDGFLVVLTNYHDQPEAYDAILKRPLADWGKIPGLRTGGSASDGVPPEAD